MLLLGLLIAAMPSSDKATKLVEVMRAGIKPLNALAAEAKNDNKDIVRRNCLDEKLAQARGLLRIGEQSLAQLQEAIVRNDPELGAKAGHKIDVAAVKSGQVASDARACVGAISVNAGDTQVIVKFTGKEQPDPTVLTILDLLAPPLLLRPFQVSPYQ